MDRVSIGKNYKPNVGAVWFGIFLVSVSIGLRRPFAKNSNVKIEFSFNFANQCTIRVGLIAPKMDDSYIFLPSSIPVSSH